MRDFLKCIKALNDENRIVMLKLLTEKDICVCEMKELFELSESQVSRSLRMLFEAGFLKRWHDDKCVVYMADRTNSNENCRAVLDMVSSSWNDNETINTARENLQQVIANKVRQEKM